MKKKEGEEEEGEGKEEEDKGEEKEIKKKKKREKNLDKDLTPFTQISSKWNIDLNVKCNTIRFLQENKEKNLHDLRFFFEQFLNITPKQNL